VALRPRVLYALSAGQPTQQDIHLESLLLIACVLIYLGYVALRLSLRLRLPVVTSFLLLGIVVGPEGLGLVSTSTVASLRIVEPVALGMITFAAGEQLRVADMKALSGRHYLAVALETVFPVLLVGTGAWLVTGRLEIALPMGAIAGTTGLATVMSTLKESGAKGAFARLVGFASATDNFFAILVFSLVLPLVAAMETGRGMGAMYAERLLGMLASVAIGFLLGLLLSKLVKQVRSSTELSMVVLAHVLLMVGVTYYLGFSVLLAGLTMGATAVNLTRDARDRDRAFAALRTLEFPVIAMFFLWAGASLHIRALAGIGLLFAVYAVARAAGKLTGPLVVAWGSRGQEARFRMFAGLGVSLLPQAGAAVGLAILARDNLPANGQTILAAVLGAVVIFELIGPVGVHWAARRVGEARATPDGHPLTLDEAVKKLEDRKARVVAVSGLSNPAAALDLPRNLAARLQADLVIIPLTNVGNSKGTMAAAPVPWPESSEVLERDGSSSEDGLRSPFSLDSSNVDALLDLVKGHGPDVLFVSLPKQMRPLLGSATVLAERIGCPVFEIPPGQLEQSRQGTVASRMPSIERVAGELAVYRTRLQRTRIVRRLMGNGESH
jgi:Kef-type K+ transport system membrane component KefB